MQKLLISWVLGASLFVGGCSSFNNLPLVYKPDIQQGNIVDQEMVDSLRPGMSKTQVRFIMGSPALVDVFHLHRWDYVYSMQRGGGERRQRQLSLYFEDNKLMRIEGDFRPQPKTEAIPASTEGVVRVPDYAAQEKGIITRALEGIGLGNDQ